MFGRKSRKSGGAGARTEASHLADELAAVNRSLARIVFDTEGNIIEANENFLGAVGYTSEEVAGKHHRIFMFPEDLEGAAYGQFWADLASGKMLTSEYRRRRKDGSDLWIHASYTPITDSDGKPYRVVKYARDITDRVIAVSALQHALHELSQGDLREPIREPFSDQFDMLRVDFNNAQSRLGNAMRDITQNAFQMHGSAANLSQSSRMLATRTESQALSLEQTANDIKSLAESVKASSAGADHARSIVEVTKNKAQSGSEIMASARDAMDRIAKSSGEISDITSVIDQISFQTNLLALNAGVEAARAGDAGRGFAVVASEVRTLAQQSAEAATKIAELIRTSVDQVENGVNLVSRTNEALNEIGTHVGEALTHVAEIANSTSDQAVRLENVSSAIEKLDDLTKQNAAMTEENTGEIQVLANEVQALNKSVDAFQIDDSHEAPMRKAS